MSWHSSSHTDIPPKPSTNVTSPHNHSHIIILSTTKPKNGSAMASSSYDGVPGWGIALLVLASVILLLLLIFFILALWHWCCHREETGLINVTGSPKPYDREPSAPEFLTMDPYQKIYPEDFDKPKKNRTGMYVVNP
nr:mucin-1-like [Paramormyrops kingsleyae]